MRRLSLGQRDLWSRPGLRKAGFGFCRSVRSTILGRGWPCLVVDIHVYASYRCDIVINSMDLLRSHERLKEMRQAAGLARRLPLPRDFRLPSRRNVWNLEFGFKRQNDLRA